MRNLRHLFGEHFPPAPGIFARQRRTFDRATSSIKMFQLLTLLIPVAYWNAAQELLASGLPEPLWPARFVLAVLPPAAATSLFLSVTIMGFLIGLFFPGSRIARILSFVGNFLVVALLFSRGKIYHTLHALLWTQFLFLFLPSWKEDGAELSRSGRQSVLVTFGAAQAMLLLGYCMSGFAKIADGITHWASGGLGSFSPHAMAYQISYHLMSQYQTPTLLQSFAVSNPYLGFPVYLLTIYVQVTALWILFKNSLHRPWGVALIAFHLGTKLFMGILFLENTLLLGVLLVMSPFHVVRPWREWVGELPLVDLLLKFMNRNETRSVTKPE